jgi:uncharacterized membrane protein
MVVYFFLSLVSVLFWYYVLYTAKKDSNDEVKLTNGEAYFNIPVCLFFAWPFYITIMLVFEYIPMFLDWWCDGFKDE